MWLTFFKEGGWGMYPTSLFGFFLVAVGFLFLLRPERRFVPVLWSLGIVNIGSGLLGFFMGIINTMKYVQRVETVDQLKMFALGCAESLNNVVLSLILIVLTALIASIGAFRAARVFPSKAATE